MSNGATSSDPAKTRRGDGATGSGFTTRDAGRIGTAFLGWMLVALILGTVFAMLPAVKALGAEDMEARAVFQALTYQRVLLVFMFLVPALPSILGFLVLPRQIGADEMASPTLSRCSLRMYALGLLLTVVSVVWDPVAVGWTLSMPLSLSAPGKFGLLALGLFFASLSWFFTGANFLLTVHRNRAPGMGWLDMPVMAWSMYLAGYQLLISGLLFGIMVLYLVIGRSISEPLIEFVSDPLRWRTYFWFLTTPVVFFALIPAAGVVSEVVSGLARRKLACYGAVVGSLIALLALSFISWGVHLGAAGQDPALTFVFQTFAALAVVPVALIVFSWLTTLYRGDAATSAPATFVVAFLLHAGIALFMGLFLLSPSVAAYLGTTMFVSTLLDYLVWGAVLSALLAGLHHWWTGWTGAPYSDASAQAGGILYAVGLNLALLPRVVMGTRGVAQDMMAFAGGSAGLSKLSLAGMLVMLVGLGWIIVNLVASWCEGKGAAQVVWDPSVRDS